MVWTNNIVIEFLELYKSEQHIWDPKHPLHKNRQENNKAWQRIQSSLSIHVTIEELKKKKESLMAAFRLIMRKKKKYPEKHAPVWFAYHLMESFLGEKYECDSSEQLETFYTSDGTYKSEPSISEPNIARPTGSDHKQTQTKNSITSQNKPNNVEKNTTSEYFYTKKRDYNSDYRTSGAGENIEDDEYELYAQLLAKKLRKLDEHQRDLAMHEIDNIMFQAKMQTDSLQTRSYPISSTPIHRKIKSPIFVTTQENNQQYVDENISYEDHIEM